MEIDKKHIYLKAWFMAWGIYGKEILESEEAELRLWKNMLKKCLPGFGSGEKRACFRLLMFIVVHN